MKRKTFLVSVLVIAVIGLASILIYNFYTTNTATQTSVSDIRRMDHEAFRIVSRSHISEEEAFRLYTTLAVAEMMFLDDEQTRESIVPLAHSVICAVLPNNCVFIWRTLGDHKAFLDEETMRKTSVIMKKVENDITCARTMPNISPSEISQEEAEEEYKAILMNRTIAHERAATLWRAGQGTRRASGILFDMITDYITVGLESDIHEIVRQRAYAMRNRAFASYCAAKTFAETYDYPPVRAGEEPMPYIVAAIYAVAKEIRPLLPEYAQKDLDAELAEAFNAFLWSGDYYPYTVRDAVRIGESYTQQP